MPYIAFLLKHGSVLLFCLSMSLLIIPHIVIWIFYTIPQSIRFSISGKIYSKCVFPTIVKLLSWLAIVSLLYVIAFLSDAEIFADLLYSPVAIFSWGIAALNLFRLIFFRHAQFQDEFYEKIYLKFIKSDVLREYDDYIGRIKDFTFFQLISENSRKLSYLQKKAVLNRIRFLENNPNERRRIEVAFEMKASAQTEK